MYNIYILGFSIDAAIYARELAECNSNITFLKTGKLGYPNDDVSELLDENGINLLKRYLPELNFNKITNSTYMFLPYNQLEFVNSHNGLVTYPLNKTTFECAEEWEQMEACSLNLHKFKNKLELSNNYINLYKKFFPKWLYDSMLKYVSVNKWVNYKQSKLTKDALSKEINTDYLAESNTNTLYSPTISYKEICEKLLTHKNIKTKEVDISKLRKLLTTRQKNCDIIVMDNRVDMFCGYSQGKFERMVVNVEYNDNDNMEELMDVSQGIILTPTKEYWCVINDFGKVKKLYSKEEKLASDKESILIPSINNEKTYYDYKKLLNLYSNKHLMLENFINTYII